MAEEPVASAGREERGGRAQCRTLQGKRDRAGGPPCLAGARRERESPVLRSQGEGEVGALVKTEEGGDGGGTEVKVSHSWRRP